VTGRVCTQGGSQCAPIEVVGQCKDYCTKTTRTVGGTNYEVWTDCEDDAANTFAEVTTAALES
jgi:hypothetical protein